MGDKTIYEGISETSQKYSLSESCLWSATCQIISDVDYAEKGAAIRACNTLGSEIPLPEKIIGILQSAEFSNVQNSAASDFLPL